MAAELVQLLVYSKDAAPDLGLLGANVHDLRRGIQLYTFWRTDFWNMMPRSLVDSYQRFEASAAKMFRAGDAYLSIWRWRQHTSEIVEAYQPNYRVSLCRKIFCMATVMKTSNHCCWHSLYCKREVSCFVFTYSFATEYNGGKWKRQVIGS